LHTLQGKINTYLTFIESGEIDTAYSHARGRKRVIDIVFKFRPSAAVETFLRNAIAVVEPTGIVLRSRVRP
jgi:hypothetical protein